MWSLWKRLDPGSRLRLCPRVDGKLAVMERGLLLLSGLRFDDDIFGKCLECHSALLHHRNRNMSRFPSLNVAYDTGFARMCSADDIALGAVYQLAGWFGFHHYFSIEFLSNSAFRERQLLPETQGVIPNESIQFQTAIPAISRFSLSDPAGVVESAIAQRGFG